MAPLRLPPPHAATAEADSPSRPRLPRMQGLDSPDITPCSADNIDSSNQPRNSPQRDPRPESARSAQLSRTPPPGPTFHAVNENDMSPRKVEFAAPARRLATLAPAPLRPAVHFPPRQPQNSGKGLYDLPPELRVEIYKLVLQNVKLHVLPREAEPERRAPHALTQVNKTVRNEVLPLIHANCPMVAVITDFNFYGLLDFVGRIPPHELHSITKNKDLRIQLCTSAGKTDKTVTESGSLRSWLQYRADKCRPQAKWKYCGVKPPRKVESDVRRRIKRMTEEGKKQEFIAMAKAIHIDKLEPKEKANAREE